METSLILLKPDCVTKKLTGEIIRRFETAGFQIRGLKMMRLNNAILKEHYAHLIDKPFYPEIESFMQSAPVVALALSGENVIARIRDLIGPTDSKKAAKGTVRGDYGVDVMVNIVHASDSLENAQLELKRFFANSELFDFDPAKVPVGSQR
ncbi:MAG: nucleoside-diphosphate kinase [Verrucomicrobiae bacterium]|nr:nucleoside-diphosphate kinase [Verrucomicrobiae bacterium]